jgi:hypothetical protein
MHGVDGLGRRMGTSSRIQHGLVRPAPGTMRYTDGVLFAIGALSSGSCMEYAVHLEKSVQLKVHFKSSGNFECTLSQVEKLVEHSSLATWRGGLVFGRPPCATTSASACCQTGESASPLWREHGTAAQSRAACAIGRCSFVTPMSSDAGCRTIARVFSRTTAYGVTS